MALYRFSTEIRYNNDIKFWKIFIILFLSKIIYVNDRVLIFSLRILKLIGRKLRVKNDFKSECTVITAVVHMMTDDNLQASTDCSPSSWQKEIDSESKQAIICQTKEKES